MLRADLLESAKETEGENRVLSHLCVVNTFYGGQSKSPEYLYSFTDVAGFPNLTVQ